MKFIGYFVFYLIFILLESFGSFIFSLPIKFDILMPAVIYSVSLGSISAIFFVVLFGLITGLSQGYVWVNINIALLIYLLVNMLKNTFHISSKHFIFLLTISTLFMKSLLLFSFKLKVVSLDKNALFFILTYVLVNGLLSFYLINMANHLSILIKKYEKNTYNP